MEYDPPSAMLRFGMFVLAGGVALVFAFWGVLKYIEQPSPTRPTPKQPLPAHQSASPSPVSRPGGPSPLDGRR